MITNSVRNGIFTHMVSANTQQIFGRYIHIFVVLCLTINKCTLKITIFARNTKNTITERERERETSPSACYHSAVLTAPIHACKACSLGADRHRKSERTRMLTLTLTALEITLRRCWGLYSFLFWFEFQFRFDYRIVINQKASARVLNVETRKRE